MEDILPADIRLVAADIRLVRVDNLAAQADNRLGAVDNRPEDIRIQAAVEDSHLVGDNQGIQPVADIRDIQQEEDMHPVDILVREAGIRLGGILPAAAAAASWTCLQRRSLLWLENKQTQTCI